MNLYSKYIIYLFIIFIGIILGIIKWTYLENTFKKVTVLLIATFIAEASALIILNFYSTNVLIYMIFDPIQVLIISYIFAIIYDNVKLKKGVKIAGIAISVIVLISSIIKYYTLQYNNGPVAIKSIFFLSLCLLKYREMMLNPSEKDILKDPAFWFVTALLFFNAINIMYWLTFSSLVILETRIFARNVLFYSNLLFYGIISLCLIFNSVKPRTIYDK